MAKINICFHIGNISNCGGTEKVTTDIANLLLNQDKQYNVIILSTYYDKEKGPFFKGNTNIKYESLFDNQINLKLHYVKAVNKLNKFIIDNKIDVLIGVDTILSLFDIPAVRKTRCKYIAWEHFNFNYNLGLRLRDIARKYACLKADAMVVLTDKDKNYFRKNLKIKTNLLKIYNPFIIEDKKNVYNPNTNIIMSSGRLTYQKGFDILLEVAKLLKEKTTDFKWIILGEGEDRQLLENKIQEYGLTDLVELKGRVKDVNKYYAQSKMFVLTSRFEGLVLVILEAKANKLPVISFDCDCGPSEMIKDDINGYLIDNFDVVNMSEKIYDLLCDDKKCVEFSSDSALDMDKFYPENIIVEWDKLIKEVISK